MTDPALDDDEELILLEGKAAAALRELQEVDLWLSEHPRRGVPLRDKASRRLYREARKQKLRAKKRAETEYRQLKASLRFRRTSLRLAARDVERDLTDPKDLIAALVDAAVWGEAWRHPTHQETIDLARRWLGQR